MSTLSFVRRLIHSAPKLPEGLVGGPEGLVGGPEGLVGGPALLDCAPLNQEGEQTGAWDETIASTVTVSNQCSQAT